MSRMIDRVGQRIGRLLVLARVGRDNHGHHVWRCECDCGTITETTLIDSKSCGCLHRELLRSRLTTHGRTNTPEYWTWQNIKQRCYNARPSDKARYQGRGIKVCRRWLDSFESFYADMGPRPSPLHSIERLDNDGHYEPKNCVWATTPQQQRNRRDNVWLEFDGRRMVLADWAKELGVDRSRLLYRLRRGLSEAQVLDPRPRKRGPEARR